MITILLYILFFAIATLTFLISFSSYWAKSYFKNVGLSEMMYTLSQPLTGSDSTQINSFLFDPLLKSILISLVLTFLLFFANIILKKKGKFSIKSI